MDAIFNGCENLSGVYKIYNNLKDRTYYGSTKKFSKRYKDHYDSLFAGKHFNRFLQKDFVKTGFEHFTFEILEITSIEERKIMEQIYLDEYWANRSKCYNVKRYVTLEEKSTFSHTPEQTSKLLSENTKKLWQDPEYVEKTNRNRTIAQAKPENKANQINAQKISWDNDPERKAKATERGKKLYESDKENFYNMFWSQEAIDKRIEIEKQKDIKRHKKLCDKKISEIDWTFEPPKNIHGKNYRKKYKTFFGINLLSPEGILYKNITNLRFFAECHGMFKSRLLSLSKLTTLSCHGWVKYFDLESNYDLFEIQTNKILNPTNEQKERLNTIVGYSKLAVEALSFISPEGVIFTDILNLSQFTREHKVNRKRLEDLKNGTRESYKGWKLHIPT